MAYNVWFVIWPNQKKALGMIEVTPEVKAASAKIAMLFREQIRFYLYQCYYQW